MYTTQTKLNAAHVRYNIKIVPQQLIIGDKQISKKNFERKLREVISRFSTEKSFKTEKSLIKQMLFKRKMQVMD